MEALTYNAEKLLKDRLLLDIDESYERWAEFSYELLNSDTIVPLWADKNFRWGYQLVLYVREDLNLDTTTAEGLQDKEKDTLIEEICEHFRSGDDNVESCKSLIKGVEMLARDAEGLQVKDYNEIKLDLQVFLVISKMIEDCNLKCEEIEKLLQPA